MRVQVTGLKKVANGSSAAIFEREEVRWVSKDFFEVLGRGGWISLRACGGSLLFGEEEEAGAFFVALGGGAGGGEEGTPARNCVSTPLDGGAGGRGRDKDESKCGLSTHSGKDNAIVVEARASTSTASSS